MIRNPSFITLVLTRPCQFGQRISFQPEHHPFLFTTPQFVIDLNARIDAAQQQSKSCRRQ
jgi:hypothetical protein